MSAESAVNIVRAFWPAEGLIALCERILSSGRSYKDNPGKFSSGGERQLFDWARVDAPDLWDACYLRLGPSAVLEPGGVVAPRMIRYGDGVTLGPHVDQGHTRLIVLAKAATAGGLLSVEDEVVLLDPGDAVVFNDATSHSVSKVVGERWTVTMGVS